MLQERIWNMLIRAPASRGMYQSSRDVPMEMTHYAVPHPSISELSNLLHRQEKFRKTNPCKSVSQQFFWEGSCGAAGPPQALSSAVGCGAAPGEGSFLVKVGKGLGHKSCEGCESCEG